MPYKRLLIFTEFYPINGKITGGLEARTFSIVEALKRTYDITVITSRQGNELNDQEDHLKVLRVGPSYPFSNNGYLIKRFLFIINAYLKARKFEADIVEGTNFLTYLPAALTGIMRGIPRVATYHESWIGGLWIKNKGWWTGILGEICERIILKIKWTRIFSVSEFTKQALVKVKVPEHIIDIIPNGVDILQFDFSVEKEKRPTVCLLTRFVPEKKVDVLIRALPYVINHVSDVQVHIIGNGAELENLKQLANLLGVYQYVKFFGAIAENHDKFKILKAGHVFAFPSEMEGFGIVLLEAMAAGLPIVCTDIPPLREVTKEQGTLLFKPSDPQDLAQKLITLLTDKQMYDQKVKEAKERVKMFALPNIIRQLKEAYAKL